MGFNPGLRVIRREQECTTSRSQGLRIDSKYSTEANMQTRNRKFFLRATARLALIVTLTITSIRIQADTGSCGGASVTIPFTDVPSSNIFFCAIAEAYFSGLTNGTSATTYSPSANVPREQMAAFVSRTLDQSLKRGSRRAGLGMWWRDDSRTYIVGEAPN